jgi:hypothetical protein
MEGDEEDEDTHMSLQLGFVTVRGVQNHILREKRSRYCCDSKKSEAERIGLEGVMHGTQSS